MRRVLLSLLVAALLLPSAALAQSPSIAKIDPPNWYAAFPQPMLLLRGENLAGAKFTVSDPALVIERTAISENGHWAQLWFAASPAAPETVQIKDITAGGHTSAPFKFVKRRDPATGMAGFSQSDVIYLIATDRFADGDHANDGPDATSAADSAAATGERDKPKGWHGGDLRGIAEHIDYLQSLGVTTVWPTPVYQNHGPEAYHGYHATDYYAVDEHYGTLDDLRSLVADLHKHCMKLILDTVPNHVGPFHPWVKDEPTPDWFHGTAEHHVMAEYNFNALIDPHASEAARGPTLHGWFVDLLPDMNTDNPAVALYLRQNAVWWIEETGADGLRIDTFPYVDRPFWHAFTSELRGLYPHITEVGEVSDANPEITSAYADGVTRVGVDTGLYTPFDFPFYHAARDVFAGKQPFTRLSRVLGSDALYPHPERLVPFLGNHDESRFAEAVPDPALREVAYALLLTTRGTPQLYQGDELAQPGGDDPENRHDFPGGFVFDRSTGFRPDGRFPAQQHEYAEVQHLLTLRRGHPALQTGKEQVLHADDDTLVYVRTLKGSEQVLVALNKGNAAHTITLPIKDTAVAGVRGAFILLGAAGAVSVGSQGITLNLAPEAVAIASLK